jgi:hypothetical protein
MVIYIFIIFPFVVQIFGSSMTKICKNAHMNVDISVCLSSYNNLRSAGKFFMQLVLGFTKFLWLLLFYVLLNCDVIRGILDKDPKAFMQAPRAKPIAEENCLA